MTVCLQGSIHQGSQFFNELSRGRQCAFIAFHALFSCESELPVQLWTTEFIDQILIKGDRSHVFACTNKPINTWYKFFACKSPASSGFHWNRKLSTRGLWAAIFGSCSISFESDPPYWSLNDALMNTFMISRYAICVPEGYTIAIIKTSLQLQEFFTFLIVTLVTPRVGPLAATKELQFWWPLQTCLFWQIIFARYHNASMSASLKY